MLKLRLEEIFKTQEAQKIISDNSYQNNIQESLNGNKNQIHLSSTFFTSETNKEGIQLTHSLQNITIKEKLPGQRLYYQGMLKKYSQIQTFQKAHLDEEFNNASKKQYFKMNQHSKLLLVSFFQRKKRKIKNNSETEDKAIKKEEILTSQQLRQMEELSKCTFHPTLISKQINTNNRSTEVFQTLYEDQKLRKLKQDFYKTQFQIERKNCKKMKKQELQTFLKKNEQFILKKNKKANILREYLEKHDHSSGQKYFEPKINQNIKRRWEDPQRNVSNTLTGKSNKFYNIQELPQGEKKSIWNKNDDKLQDFHEQNQKYAPQINVIQEEASQ